jgi:hypothetical protein
MTHAGWTMLQENKNYNTAVCDGTVIIHFINSK